MNNARKSAVFTTVNWFLQEMQEYFNEEDRNYQQRLHQLRRKQKRIAICLMRRRLFMDKSRGPYCMPSFMNEEIVAIFNWDEEKTKKHIRVTPNALALFCTKIQIKPQGWSKEFEAVVFLYWLASGACFRMVAVSFQLARSTAHMICTRVLQQTVGLLHELIRVPVGEEVDVVGEGFANLTGSPVFRNAVGAIDGCQIRTLVPSQLHDQYINRKLYYSINLQGLVDHRGMFLDICCGFPGSVHDMRVLCHSGLWLNGTYPPNTYFILGDGGYQTRLHPICIVTPFRAPLTRQQANFNHHLSKGRCIVEMAFGAMQMRWRSIFTKALEVKLKSGVQVIAAYAILHNICITAGDVLRLDAVGPVPDRQPVRDEVEGIWFRDMLLNLHTAYQHQQNDAN